MLIFFQFNQITFALLVALTLLGPLLLAALVARFPKSGLLLHLAPLTVIPALLLAVGPRREIFLAEWVLGLRLGVDAASAIFLLFSSILWLCASWFALPYLAHDQRRARFSIFFLVAQAGNLGLVIAQDIATFYFCFALMSFASYVLVVHDEKPASQKAGRIYLTMALLGEVLQFIAFSMLALQVPDARLADVPAAVAASPYRSVLIVLLVVSLGIKAGLVPLHVWLPLAHPVAPTPASAVLSGAMIKAGLLGWIRFLPLGKAEWPVAGEVLVILGLVGSLGGVLLGVTQRHPKAVLAYSSISQMGLIILLVGIGLFRAEAAALVLTAAVLYALHHGLAKGALFLGVGMMTSAPGGKGARRAILVGCALAGLALAGAPWTSGMLAKTLLKNVTGLVSGDSFSALGWLLNLSAVGTTLLMARFLVRLRATAHDAEHHPAASGVIWAPWLLLLFSSLMVSWLAVPDLTGAVIEAGFKGALLWKLSWPIMVGIAVAALVFAVRRGRSALPEAPAGDVLALYLLVVGGVKRVCLLLADGLHTLCERSNRVFERVAQIFQRRAALLTRAENHLADYAALGFTLLIVASLTAWLAR